MNSVSPKAKIGTGVSIGPYTIIEDDVEIGNNVIIGSNVLIAKGARISDNVRIHHGAVLSTNPQDLKFKGEHTILEVGAGTEIREYATLNRGTNYSGKTTVGGNCLIMAYAHIAHDCIVGNNVILANSVNMGGHVEIGDFAIIGGLVGIHQFSKIGNYVIIASNSRVVKDIPPYVRAGNSPVKYEGINVIGLNRNGFSKEKIALIQETYRILYRSGLNITEGANKIKQSLELTSEVNEILSFIERSERGLIRG